MEAGRELDAFIAREVLKWTDVKVTDHQTDRDYRGHWQTELVYRPEPTNLGYYEVVPHFSTKIKAAFRMFEDCFPRFSVAKSEMPDHYYVEIVYHLGMGSFETYKANAETAAHAMCLAAKKVLERDYDAV